MKNFTFNFTVFVFGLCFSMSFAQEKNDTSKIFNQDLTFANEKSLEQTGIIRCASTEYELYLQETYPDRMTNDEFENWLAPKIQELQSQRLAEPNVLQTIPVIFHIITDGFGAENLSQAAIQAQVDQLNIDYRNLAGSSYPQAGDAEIEFCLAQQDESGSAMAENGINRVTAFGSGTFTNTFVDSNIKPATQWDPTKYMNIWVVEGLTNGSFSLLGYAQFPDSSGLAGLPSSGGAANTDGVVVIASSVGSVANPNPNGVTFNAGRTLTHEVGHWLGLRHIWGDTTACTDDDFCPDTPDASDSNFGCPVGTDSCAFPTGNPDMIENYMDYTDDTCMNTFTADQVTRFLTVLANSPRRVELVTTSTVCQPAIIFDLDGGLEIDDLNLVDCSGSASITPDIILTNRGNNTLTSATIDYYVDSDTPSTYNWSGTLNFNESETIALSQLPVTGLGGHTFTMEITSANGGTDEQPSNDNITEIFNTTGTYCTSVANTTYQTSTTGVEFNTISNLNTGKPSGYSDYTSISTDVNRESSYDLTVYANSDGNYQIITYVWIDWNQNCSFDDPGEQYDLGTSANIVNDPTVNSPLSVTVPSDAVLGNTRMRVTTKYTNPGENQFPTSCENNHDAEVEDYTINVENVLGVEDFTRNDISLYPNPVKDRLTIRLANSDLPDNYEVYNMLGQMIQKMDISSLSDLEVNTSDLSNGMYFMKLTKGNSTISLPFIKN